MHLLKQLCSVHAPSGEESVLTEFLLSYICSEKKNWKVQPHLYAGKGFQNSIILVFGKPRTAIFAHIDSIGFTVRYGEQLIRIGMPELKTGYLLTGKDSQGKIACKLNVGNGRLTYKYSRNIERGTSLTFTPLFRETQNYIQCSCLDNRLGVWNALQVARTLKNGIIAFSTWEEHGGGSVGYIAKFIFEKYNVSQALISDITWVSEGVKPGKGVVISMRDSSIPRRVFVEDVIDAAKKSNIIFQIEVESTGGSDGNHIQSSPYPIDWCFVGAPEENVHTPDEKVNKSDIMAMTELYKYLMNEL